ncbi:RGS domain-containing protein [Coniochaeta sp. 2T2.1]|nr:RGS domain-containing protein [Coniochaeta sp. 2T2.1]
MSSSRPTSLAYLTSTITHPPTLHEILSNVAPAPWTQAAFMAFLSQNHCLETLEFTMEANRYTSAYSEIMSGQSNFKGNDGKDYLCDLFQKLIGSYVVPDSFREVNLPAPVRDRLLSLSAHGTPPHPSELDDAIRIVYELMNDSVLGPFLESFAVPQQEEAVVDEKATGRQGRSRMRIPKESSSSNNEEPSRSPKSSFLPLFGIHRSEHLPIPSASTHTDTPETSTSEDAWTPASPREEPMTPPTTPPTSDWGFSASPGTLQRAINAHNTGWKKMGQKLGLSRKSGRGKQSNSSVTSGVADTEETHSSSRNSGSFPQ